MTQQGPGWVVGGLTVGQVYTGVLEVWSAPGAPPVVAQVDAATNGPTGPTVAIGGAGSARVVFVATATSHVLSLEPVGLVEGQTYGDTWVSGVLAVVGNYTGPWFAAGLYVPTPVSVYDYEARQGAQTDYIAADANGVQLATVRVTIPRWGTWLKSPGRPTRNTRVYLENEGAVTRTAQRLVVQRQSGGLPVVLSQPRAARQGEVRLLALEGEQDAAVSLLLSDGATVLLDTAPEWSVPWRYVSVGDTTTARPHEGTLMLDRPARLHVLADLIEQPAPLGLTVQDPQRTYDALPGLFGSYVAMAAVTPSYEALGTGEAV